MHLTNFRQGCIYGPPLSNWVSFMLLRGCSSDKTNISESQTICCKHPPCLISQTSPRFCRGFHLKNAASYLLRQHKVRSCSSSGNEYPEDVMISLLRVTPQLRCRFCQRPKIAASKGRTVGLLQFAPSTPPPLAIKFLPVQH